MNVSLKPALIATAILLAITGYSQDKPYLNPGLDTEQRVNDLMQRMTWQEKLAQTYCIHLYRDMLDTNNRLKPDGTLQEAIPLGMGQLGKPNWALDKGPEESARIINKIQKQVVESNRLGIPAIFHEEGLHGLWARGSTVFPQAIGMSCSWEPELSKQIFRAIAREVRSRGSHQVNTPMLDVCRDPRWGRIEESYGEDPFLISQFAEAIVRGLQGPDTHIDESHVVATIKHFAGYGLTQGGLNKTPVFLGRRRLREVVLPPFKAAVEAGALSVMPAYNEIDGIPCHANEWLLKDLLRDEWGFEGYVVSDYGAVQQLNAFHRVTLGDQEAGKLAMKSGVDLEMDNPYCFSQLKEAVKEDTALQNALNRAVRSILRVKFKLGLFEDPYVDPARAKTVNRSDEHIDLSLKAAEESIVMLKNRGDILPLDQTELDQIAVIGPHADNVHYGGYSTKHTRRGVTFYQGIKNYVGSSVDVQHAEGCKIHKGSGHWLDGVDHFAPADSAKNRERIRKAVQIAENSDVVILAVGGTAVTCGEFIGHRSSLDLFGMQNELVNAITNTDVPVVACLVNGRPLAVDDLDRHAEAILETWYLGEQAGNALARTVFGEVNPSGKLTLSFPKSAGHVPVYYSKKPSGRHTYLAEDSSVLYPFGYGLSYTHFDYSPLTLDRDTGDCSHLALAGDSVQPGEAFRVSFSLTNTGQYKGEEIIQLYISDKTSSVTRPVKELKGFKKVSLQPGESRNVEFTLSAGDLKFLNRQLQQVVEPGQFHIMIGSSSQDIRLRDVVTVAKQGKSRLIIPGS